MRKLIEWMESNDKRTRKVLSVFTGVVWAVAVVCSYVLARYGYDTVAVLSLVTAQYATVIGFYMMSDANKD